VQLHLEVGVRVAIGEGASIADGDEAMLVERVLLGFLDLGFARDRLTNLPQALTLQSEGHRNSGVE